MNHNTQLSAVRKNNNYPVSMTHEAVDVLSDDPQLGEGAGQRRDGLVSRVRSLVREAHREVPEEEFVVPP